MMIITIAICPSISISNYNFSYAQKSTIPQTNNNNKSAYFSSPTTKSGLTTDTTPIIKIISPNNGQEIPVANNNLVISGTSSDNSLKDCGASVIMNGVKPYQKAVATGSNAANDYSSWIYRLNPHYTTVKEGSNKITAKIMCIGNPNNLTKWTSVNVTGVKTSSAATTSLSNTTSSKESRPELHVPITPSNSSGSSSAIPTPTVTSTSKEPLQILLGVEKNPIIAGDIQTITVTVHNPAIPNSLVRGANVSGQVSNMLSSSSTSSGHIIKQFGGITDSNGQVLYSWIVPDNLKSDMSYKAQADASHNGYHGKSGSVIFAVKLSSNYNDNNFILAQANRKFTNGLNEDINKFTQDILNSVRKGLDNSLR